MDYYKILGVSSSSTPEDIRRAYIEKAKLLHPDKAAGSARSFQELHDAYEVLADPIARAEYEIATHDCRALDSSSIEAAFRATFGYEIHAGSPASSDCSTSSLSSSLSSASFSQYAAPQESAPAGTSFSAQVEIDLTVELAELYVGCTKRLRVDRKIFNGSSYGHIIEEVLVRIGPGWRTGTKITFQGKGDQHPGQAPQDIIFTLKEQPHCSFRRRGNHLHTHAAVPHTTALKGGSIALTHLDGRVLTIPLAGPVQPGSSVVLLGEGMPLAREPSKRGNLYVTVHMA